jgi:DNA-binding winged helix-turn-helix (wHTH) protein
VPAGLPSIPPVRYRFGPFVLSPAERLLRRDGVELSLIPRYFDLLHVLVARRPRALDRRELMDRVWSDVVVSDGALTQAVRTLRRALGDDGREPVFIRTVSRHGYRFAYTDVIEEPDDGGPPPPPPGRDRRSAPPPDEAAFEGAFARILDPGAADDERREAAEALHGRGTEEALRRLAGRPGHPRIRALLRDSRWDVPGAGPVPILRAPGALATILSLAALRLRRAARLAEGRWASASAGGLLAGSLAGGLGGALLLFLPDTGAPAGVVVPLALAGGVAGGLGAAGVGAGLAAAEALARSFRGLALAVLGALGGLSIGLAAHAALRSTLAGLFGRGLTGVGGGLEGLVLGAAAGAGYALATPREGGGMAAPRGAARWRAALVTGLCCALAAVILSLLGGRLGATSVNAVARSFHGAQVQLEPVARLLGEPELGVLTRSVLGAFEGLFFGAGLVLGLTRRPGC